MHCMQCTRNKGLVCRTSPLRRFMPSVSRMERNADGALKDPFGRPLAPFIVMERGEGLQQRVKNGPVDPFVAAQVSLVVHELLDTCKYFPDEAVAPFE